jgi:predicted alpha/beta superfamily hydrolase
MAHWQDYRVGRAAHTVAGTLLIKAQVHSPQLHNERHILVWLPETYERSTRRYPVLYMQDGQNLFDAYTSFAGEWRVDETMVLLADEGYEAIIVGIPNNENRLLEYSPYPDQRLRVKQGKGDQYLQFITDTLKPLIDKDFRTLPNRESTGIAGSSMGGLISLYGFLRRSDVFGFGAALSPSYWFGHRAIFQTVDQLHHVNGKLYLDIGGEETSGGSRRSKDNYYLLAVRELSEHLAPKLPTGNLHYVEDVHGRHNESDWARRLPTALRAILPKI